MPRFVTLPARRRSFTGTQAELLAKLQAHRHLMNPGELGVLTALAKGPFTLALAKKAEALYLDLEDLVMDEILTTAEV